MPLGKVISLVSRVTVAVLGAEPVDAVEVELLRRVVVLPEEAVGRVGEVEVAVGLVDGVVGAVEPLALVAVGQGDELAVRRAGRRGGRRAGRGRAGPRGSSTRPFEPGSPPRGVGAGVAARLEEDADAPRPPSSGRPCSCGTSEKSRKPPSGPRPAPRTSRTPRPAARPARRVGTSASNAGRAARSCRASAAPGLTRAWARARRDSSPRHAHAATIVANKPDTGLPSRCQFMVGTPRNVESLDGRSPGPARPSHRGYPARAPGNGPPRPVRAPGSRVAVSRWPRGPPRFEFVETIEQAGGRGVPGEPRRAPQRAAGQAVAAAGSARSPPMARPSRRRRSGRRRRPPRRRPRAASPPGWRSPACRRPSPRRPAGRSLPSATAAPGHRPGCRGRRGRHRARSP